MKKTTIKCAEITIEKYKRLIEALKNNDTKEYDKVKNDYMQYTGRCAYCNSFNENLKDCSFCPVYKKRNEK